MGCAVTNALIKGEHETALGLLENHAYGVLNCAEPIPGIRLICVRNPWGRLEWKGKYSDNSAEWTPELMAALNVKFEDDGLFWMSYEDFTTYFNQLIILRLLTDQYGRIWKKEILEGEWDADKTAGGSIIHNSWIENPQWILSGVESKDTKLFACLHQSDQRLNWELHYELALGMYLFKTEDNRHRKYQYSAKELVTKTHFCPAREVSMDAVLQPGETYVLIPATYHPGKAAKFWLSVYSENNLTITPVPADNKVVYRSEWFDKNAGGSHNHDSWTHNPKFKISLNGSASSMYKSSTAHVAIILRQEDHSPLYYIGIYHGKLAGEEEPQVAPCKNAKQVVAEADLEAADWPYYVIPHTFEPDQYCKFEIIVYSQLNLKIEPISRS